MPLWHLFLFTKVMQLFRKKPYQHVAGKHFTNYSSINEQAKQVSDFTKIIESFNEFKEEMNQFIADIRQNTN
ncbi:hypothetical protein QUF51_00120 [Bacillus pumilus]|nr:hypothetical protein [Bacillus pumilus]